MLQQYLPLAVLKLSFKNDVVESVSTLVATVLTACGIETLNAFNCNSSVLELQQYLPLAVLKLQEISRLDKSMLIVATVLTACGIETGYDGPQKVWIVGKLQQYLPLAVLKH